MPSRTSSSEFIIPVHKFWKSLDHSFSVGMMFKMRFETEDAAERRCDLIEPASLQLNYVIFSLKWRREDVLYHAINALIVFFFVADTQD